MGQIFLSLISETFNKYFLQNLESLRQHYVPISWVRIILCSLPLGCLLLSPLTFWLEYKHLLKATSFVGPVTPEVSEKWMLV